MAIYPPILASSQDAFLVSTQEEPIYFTLPSTTNHDEIKHIQIKVVKQSNNKTIANTSIYPDGIIYKSFYPQNGEAQFIFVSSSDLEGGAWKSGYYKLQICFGKEALWGDDLSNFAAWKSRQVEQNNFSDWSTVMMLKAINTPKIEIIHRGAAQGGSGDLVIESSLNTELTTTPLFQGKFEYKDDEFEDKYRFDLYDKEFQQIDTTGWIQKTLNGSLDSCRFKKILTNNEQYIVGYEVMTVNGYHAIAQNYEFQVRENQLTELSGIKLSVESTTENGDPYGDENGVLNVFLSSDHPISGNYVLTRSSEHSNYSIWEDMKFFYFTANTFKHELLYQDFTVESGIKYKYAFQQENMAGIRTAPTYEEETLEESPERVVNFQYSYLFRDGVQLKLTFNHNVNSFKHTVLATKQDTLGSKYPTINRNGDAYYAEFPITGLISLHADDYLTFFQKREDGYYYKGEKVIGAEKYIEEVTAEERNAAPVAMIDYEEGRSRSTIKTDIDTYDLNLTDNNFFIEKVFRDKVEEFLNDGECKLYKSPSEGNIVVALMNVSMTPNSTLGRMLFSFSATAYEIMDSTLENLDEYGIIHVGSVKESLSLGKVDDEIVLMGQIAGLFKAGENLINIIKAQNEYDIGGGYQYSFMGINSIQIEGYPKISLVEELNELEAKYSTAKAEEDEELMATLEVEIEKCKELQTALDNQVSNPVITIYLNQKEISLGPNRIYQVKDSEPITSLTLKHTEPVIINYTCSVQSSEAKKSTIYGIVDSSIWGQVAGIFTETDNILDNYKLLRDSDELEVLGLSAERNFAVYQSLDISKVIEESVRHQVENLYDKEFRHQKNSDGEWEWISTDGTMIYEFQKFKSIEIEADEGTTLIITKVDNSKQTVIIGSTNKFRLQDFSDIVDISLPEEKPAFLIVNYRCLTTQTKMGEG